MRARSLSLRSTRTGGWVVLPRDFMLAMGRATRNYRHGHPALTRRRPTLPAAAATSSVIEVVEGDCIDVAETTVSNIIAAAII